MFEACVFTKERLLMTLAENLRTEIEKLCPEDKAANSLASNLLYHLCWKVKDAEEQKEETR